MARNSASSDRWRRRQSRDPVRLKAQSCGYRSRAAIKLIEIHQRERLFSGPGLVVDLGAAPGSWSQVACKFLGQNRVVAIDLNGFDPIPGVRVLRGDITEAKTWMALQHELANLIEPKTQTTTLLQGIMSDCHPPSSGSGDLDHLRSININESILEFGHERLANNGWFLSKVLAGSETVSFEKLLSTLFSTWRWLKPKASRQQSRERYVLARSPIKNTTC